MGKLECTLIRLTFVSIRDCRLGLLSQSPPIPRTSINTIQVGIFLCMRCAALHRKLGTHISKVKSLSMDKWDSAQVDVRDPAFTYRGPVLTLRRI